MCIRDRVINSDASIDISSVMTDLEPRLMEMDLGPLFGLWSVSYTHLVIKLEQDNI